MKRTHKASGWTRESIGFGNFLITPTDGSGIRKVAFMSAGSWAGLANDKREDQHKNRVVLMEGNPLPEWAVKWLNDVNDKSCRKARETLAAMQEQADIDQWNKYSDSY